MTTTKKRIDTEKMEAWIARKGLNQHFIADRCGISYRAWRERVKGNVWFYANETVTLFKLGMTDEDFTEIFGC